MPRRTLPSSTDAVLLAIGHGQLQDESLKLLELPLRALHDVASLPPDVLASVDWDLVTGAFRRARSPIALAAFAFALRELFGVVLPVSTRGGGEWWRAVRWAMDHQDPAHWYREAVSLPRSLRAARMRQLYGVDHGLALTRVRIGHLLGGASKRLTQPAR